MSERAELKAAVKRALRQRDSSNPISMTHLFIQVTGEHVIPAKKHEQSRVIRALVKELRWDGCPIGHQGGKDGGYFWARSEAELEPFTRLLHSQAMSRLKTESALKRVPFDKLLRQYQIEFETTDEDEQEVHD